MGIDDRQILYDYESRAGLNSNAAQRLAAFGASLAVAWLLIAVDRTLPIAIHRVWYHDVFRTERRALAIDLRLAIGDRFTGEVVSEVVEIVTDQHYHAIPRAHFFPARFLARTRVLPHHHSLFTHARKTCVLQIRDRSRLFGLAAIRDVERLHAALR